jgi:hypothetical protein
LGISRINFEEARDLLVIKVSIQDRFKKQADPISLRWQPERGCKETFWRCFPCCSRDGRWPRQAHVRRAKGAIKRPLSAIAQKFAE